MVKANDLLKKLSGVSGVTTDTVFRELSEMLEQEGKLMREDEYIARTPVPKVELVHSIYQVENCYYCLWYQVKTPFSPEGMALSFGFEETDKEAATTD